MKKTKLKYKEVEGQFKLYIEREHATDLELKGLQNPSSYKNLDGEECEYFKKGKQLIVWVKKIGKEPFYDSRKPADTPVYKRKEKARLITKPIEEPVSRRKSLSREEKRNSVPDSFNLRRARVPSDVRSLKNLSSDNFNLKLFKFSRYDAKEQKFKFFAGAKSGSFEIRHNDYGGIFKFDQITLNQINIATALYGNEGFVTKSFKPDWWFVVGLGIDSVYETGITLHHIYGFPYIPASAIKGICNHYAQDNGYHQSQSEFKSYYDTIFGGTDKKGKIIFLDAMPKTTPQLKTDIMNPHYPDWYGSGKAPTDTQSPRPIPFLTVEKTEYQFILASKGRNKELLEIAKNWLENALKEKGIGAKTAVGYGYMQ
jgi:CRISPR-associated protein Cmr6